MEKLKWSSTFENKTTDELLINCKMESQKKISKVKNIEKRSSNKQNKFPQFVKTTQEQNKRQTIVTERKFFKVNVLNK